MEAILSSEVGTCPILSTVFSFSRPSLEGRSLAEASSNCLQQVLTCCECYAAVCIPRRRPGGNPKIVRVDLAHHRSPTNLFEFGTKYYRSVVLSTGRSSQDRLR